MAEESNKITASDILKVLGSFALGGLAGGALGRAGMLGRAGASRIIGLRPGTGGRGLPNRVDALDKITLTYPELTGEGFNYGVVFDAANASAKRPSMNRLLNRPVGESFALAQTLDEHNAAVAGGYEPDLDAWWPAHDAQPRRSFTPSSTAVKSIRIGDDNKIHVKFANGKTEYTYLGGDNPRQASEEAAKLVLSSSIGQSLIPGKGLWGINHYDPNAVKAK